MTFHCADYTQGCTLGSLCIQVWDSVCFVKINLGKKIVDRLNTFTEPNSHLVRGKNTPWTGHQPITHYPHTLTIGVMWGINLIWLFVGGTWRNHRHS